MKKKLQNSETYKKLLIIIAILDKETVPQRIRKSQPK